MKLKSLLAAVLSLLAPAALAQDATSPNLQLLLMGQGLHNNDWGLQTNLNLQKLENALTAKTEITVAGSSATISADQSRSLALVFSGTLTSNYVATVPATPKFWIVKNSTPASAFTVSIKTPTGAAITIPRSNLVHLYWSDGVTITDVSTDGVAELTSGTALANIGDGATAVPLADLATAMELGVGSTAKFANIELKGVAESARAITFKTVDSARWLMAADGTAEAGSDAGSNFILRGFADDGSTTLGDWMQVTRKTGAVTFPGNVTITGSLSANGDSVLPGAADGVFSNLTVYVASTSSISVSARLVAMSDASNNVKLFRNINSTISTGSSGANGIDIGGAGTSRWLQVWAIGKADGTTAGILTATGAPGRPSPLPTGYIYAARVGSVWVNASSQLVQTLQKGRRAQYIYPPLLASGAAGSITAPTWSSISLAAFVPPTASELTAIGAGSQVSMIAPNGAYGSYTSSNPGCVAYSSGNTTTLCNFLIEQSVIYYASFGAAAYWRLIGWVDNL